MNKAHLNEKGFTLIEVLVAVFLLAVGVMSAANMQLTAISGNKFSKDASLAIALSEEMIDRIRLNGGNKPEIYNGLSTSANSCGSVQPSKSDCEQWASRLRDQSLGLVGAEGDISVTVNAAPLERTATVTITVRWGSSSLLPGKKRSIRYTTIIEKWVA